MKLTCGEFVGLAYASDDELREFAEEILAENAKLREEVNHLKKGDVLHVLTDQELAEQQKHEREMQASVKALEAENAKLRELVRNLLRVIPRDVSGVVIGAHGEHPTYYSFADAMRELGVDG